MPLVPHQVGEMQSRLAQVEEVNGWAQAQRALAPAVDWEAFLRDVVSAAVRR